MKKVGKILSRVLAGVLAAVALVWGGLNIAKHFIYAEYYAMETNICKNPGIGDGFVCQGISVSEESGKIFVSGYMADGSASRVYLTDSEDHAYYAALEQNGEAFTGHAGGIAVHENTVYMANGQKLYAMAAEDFLSASNGDSVEVGEGMDVHHPASFAFADEQYVYVGAFYNGGDYAKEHRFETPEGTHCAVMSRYRHDDLTTPDRVYSIRDKVQGVCFTPEGEILLSTSYGLADTVYYLYREGDAKDSGLTLNCAPVYYLGECTKVFRGPAMGEGLDYSNDKVITLTESASNKYIFGKFFFANQIVGLEIE